MDHQLVAWYFLCHWCIVNVWCYNRIGHNNCTLEQQECQWLQDMVVEDDQVVMMDVVVNQVVHLAVYASHHLAYRHLVVVVNGMVCENDHHQEESRDSAYAVHLA